LDFCRKCGKEVQPSWKFCPNCNTAHPQSNSNSLVQTANVNLKDSVHVGDVNIIQNDTKEISAAITNASKCISCESVSSTQITCSMCKRMSHCNICITEISDLRKSKRLCVECEKIESQKINKIKREQMELGNKRKKWQREDDEQRLVVLKRGLLRPNKILLIGIILILIPIYMNIQMHNFCEEKFDAETETFENGGSTSGGYDYLNDEGPYGADCGLDRGGDVAHSHHNQFPFFIFPIIVILIGLIIQIMLWEDYKSLNNRYL